MHWCIINYCDRSCFFFFNDTATTEIYTVPYTLSLHDALPPWTRLASSPGPRSSRPRGLATVRAGPRSEEHTSELQSPGTISYAVFCLKKKKKKIIDQSYNIVNVTSTLTSHSSAP